MIYIATRMINSMFGGAWQCAIERTVLEVHSVRDRLNKALLSGVCIMICSDVDELIIEAVSRYYQMDFYLYDKVVGEALVEPGDSLLVIDVDLLKRAIELKRNQEPLPTNYAFIEYKRIN